MTYPPIIESYVSFVREIRKNPDEHPELAHALETGQLASLVASHELHVKLEELLALVEKRERKQRIHETLPGYGLER